MSPARRFWAWATRRRDRMVDAALPPKRTPFVDAFLSTDFDALQRKVDEDRFRAVEELREMVPGLHGRLEGPRLYITPREADLLRKRVPHIRRALVEAPVPLSAIDVIIEEPS